MSDSEAGEAALALRRLLTELHPYPLPSTVFEFKQQPYTAPVVQLLDQFRRINQRARSDLLVGMNEFHIGLCYCSWNQFDRAQRHLGKAELRWKMAGRPAYYALAQFAIGRVLQLAMTFEAAARAIDRADGTIDELLNLTPTSRPRDAHPPLPLLKKLKQQVLDTQEEISGQLVALWAPRAGTPAIGHDQPTRPESRGTAVHYPFIVPAPRIQIAVAQPDNPDGGALERRVTEPEEDANVWYEITWRSGQFLPQLRLGDQLSVAPLTSGAAPLSRNQLLVVEPQRLDGQVRVAPVDGQGAAAPAAADPRLLVQLVRETADGRLAIIAHDQRRPLTCRRSDVIGVVDGLWRGVQGIG